MLYNYLTDHWLRQEFSQLLQLRQLRATLKSRAGPTWVHLIIELYVNPHLATLRNSSQVVYAENTIRKNLMDAHELGPWSENPLNCPKYAFPETFKVSNVPARTVQTVYNLWKRDEENANTQPHGHEHSNANAAHSRCNKRHFQGSSSDAWGYQAKRRKQW
eukprot:8072650-Prorocentrum_lima.AAC.1